MDFRLRTKPLGDVDLEFTVAMEGGEASVSLPGGLSSGSLTLPYTLSTWDSLSQIIVQVLRVSTHPLPRGYTQY